MRSRAAAWAPPPVVGQVMGGAIGQGPEEGPPPGSELSRYWQIVKNHRALVAGVFATVVSGVALGTFLQDPVYRAKGVIEISKQGTDVMPLEALFELARISDQHLQTEYGVMRSPALARRVVADLGLAQVEEYGGDGEVVAIGDAAADAAPVDPTGKDVDEGIVESFLEHLTVAPIEESRLVRVSFESTDPERAAAVVNSVFVGYMALRTEAHRTTVARLADQADSVRRHLQDSEKKLQEFVKDNQLFMAQTNDGSKTSLLDDRLRLLQEQMTQAEADNYAAQARWSEARGSSARVLGNNVVESLSGTLAELQAEYAKLRTTFTDDYPRVQQLKRQIDALEQQMQGERGRVQSQIGGEYRATSERLAQLRRAFNEQKATAERMAGMSAEYSLLRRDAQGLEELYTELRQKQKEADVSAALALSDVRVVDAAVAPPEPFKPTPKRSIPLAVLAGLLLGVCAAFIREYTDSKVRRVEELEEMNVPILALIPSAASGGFTAIGSGAIGLLPGRSRALTEAGEATGNWVRIDRDDWRGSALAEGFGNLRTSVLFSGAAGAATRSLLVTSVQAGEGKTTVSMNLAISLARLGRRVLLVDADLRRPSLHRAFKIAERPGLSEHLAGMENWRDVARNVGVENLSVIPAGGASNVPSELLSGERMHLFVQEAQEEYDFVVIDSPALMVNVSDARILTSYADGIVMVVRGGRTPREVLRRLLGHMPNVVGVVLNDLDSSQLPSYYGDYRSPVVLDVDDPLADPPAASETRRAVGED